MDTAYYVAKYSMLIFSFCTAVFGLALWRRSDQPVRLATVFLIYTQLINAVQTVGKLLWTHNMPTVHAYFVGSYILIALLYANWHKSPLAKFLRWSILLYLGIHSALIVTGIEQLDLPNKYSSQVAAFAIAAITLYTIFKIADNEAGPPIHKHPLFWISLGLFMLFPGTIFVMAAINTYYSFSQLIIYHAMADFAYCLISVGFLCLLWKD